MKTPLILISMSILVVSCGQDVSELDATNQFGDKSLTYWYENYGLSDTADKSFVLLYQDNADLLLARDSQAVPEQLKGLWYMDGNPVEDQTFSMANARTVDTETGQLAWPITTPLTFSWINTADAHKKIQQIMSLRGEYELRFYDCPEDVVREREDRYGMDDGSCLAEDQEFGIITPFVKIGGLRLKVPRSVAYFDLYLRPQEGGQDYYVWERRSALFKPMREFLAKIGLSEDKDYHRYQFTQILDEDGTPLQSYTRFEQNMGQLAADLGMDRDELLIHVCYDGVEGCERGLIQENRLKELEFSATSKDKAFSLMALPFL